MRTSTPQGAFDSRCLASASAARCASSPGAMRRLTLARATRHDRVRRVADARRVDAQHADRGLDPQAFGDGSLADQLEAGAGAEVVAVLVLGHVDGRRLAGGQAGDGDVAVVVVERGEEAGQGRDRVGRRTAVHAAVVGVVGHADLDVAVDQTAQRRRQAGDAVVPVRRVGEDDHVGRQVVGERVEEPRQVRRAGLLLALDEDLHVDGRPRLVGADGRRVQHHAGLVVARPPPVQAAVAFGRLERRASPTGRRRRAAGRRGGRTAARSARPPGRGCRRTPPARRPSGRGSGPPGSRRRGGWRRWPRPRPPPASGRIPRTRCRGCGRVVPVPRGSVGGPRGRARRGRRDRSCPTT